MSQEIKNIRGKKYNTKRVDIFLKNTEGDILIDKKGVLSPEFWSTTAVQIAASKYFMPTENSIFDLIERVISTIEAKAPPIVKEKYPNIFDDLYHAALGQRGFFNSPVWFNVGATEEPFVSACYILQLEDNMDDILNKFTVTGNIFKNGAGVGMSSSSLRESGAPLSKGGQASGPLSFLKAFDSSAGVIKSGGRLRRSANLYNMLIHHPDILEFIDIKSKEEGKARVLMNTGLYGSGMDSEAYATVAFQNVNMSVAITDAFMEAYESDSTFDLKSVVDGSVTKTLEAKAVFRRIAERAHECGDPGLQYIDTINSWNTIPFAGSIKASNPCLGGNTLMTLEDSICTIKSLDGKKGRIRQENGFFADAKFFQTGVKPLYRIKLTGGTYIDCTLDHEWFCKSNWKEAGDLLGEKIEFIKQHVDVAIDKCNFHENLVLAGFLYGDGCIHNTKTCNTLDVRFSEKDEDVMRLTEKVIGGKVTTHFSSTKLLSLYREFGFDEVINKERSFPNFNMSFAEARSFLRGLFTANGSVVSPTAPRVTLKSINTDIINGVQKLLASLGIRSYVTTNKEKDNKFKNGIYKVKESYDLNISGDGILDFYNTIGFVQEYKMQKLKNFMDNYNPQYRVNRPLVVTDIELLGKLPVYDFTILDKNKEAYGIIEGFKLHNCSEFMAPDNSACNLASLNLLKHFNIETGEFNWETFKEDVWLFLFVQDLLVDIGHYPTKEIRKNVVKYRALGLGYTNLGAVIMQMGLSYDSDEAREFAAEVTKVLTHTAFKTSQDLADIFGHNMTKRDQETIKVIVLKHGYTDFDDRPFRNSQVSLLAPNGTIGFIMDSDATGVEPLVALVAYKALSGGGSLKLTPNCVGLALTKLGYNREEGEKYISEKGSVIGFVREEHLDVFKVALGDNILSPEGHLKMMAAVQPYLSGAISKCVTGDTLITTEKGIIEIEDLSNNRTADTFNPLNLKVASINGKHNASEFYYNGIQECFKVTLRSGHKIKGTKVHPLMTLDDNSKIRWVTLSDLKVGNYVGIKLGDNLWSKNYVKLDTTKPKLYGGQKTIKYPEVLDEDLAFLLGCLASDGEVRTKTPHVVSVHNPYEELLIKIGDIISTKFGLKPNLVNDGKRCNQIRVNSKSLIHYLKQFNVKKTIPNAILQSPKSVVLAYLSGLFLDGYISIKNRKVAICLKENTILDRLQIILNNLGIYNSRISKYNKEYDHYYDEVYMTDIYAKDFAESIVWHETHKQDLVAQIPVKGISTADVIPSPLCNITKAMIKPPHFMEDKRTKNLSWNKAKELGISVGDIKEIVDNNIHFVPVTSIEYIGEHEVMDISVPETKSFIANGFVNHNTINVPSNYTVEDIENIYYQGWKMGLKAVAIYRDGSKIFAPITVKSTKDSQEAVRETSPVQEMLTVEESIDLIYDLLDDIYLKVTHKDRQKIVKKLRRRLPLLRNALTHKFTIGVHEGYLQLGFYEDGTLGEMFIRMAKEGSTLSGVMDAFATSISISLQHGLPIELFASKFIGTRFEPSGWTGDDTIQNAKSILDYIFRWVKNFNEIRLKYDSHKEAVVEVQRVSDPEFYTPKEDKVVPEFSSSSTDGNLCSNCGSTTVPNGSCQVCPTCGDSTGCGGG